MEKVKVRILRPDPRTAIALGYVKGRILEVPRETAEPWIKTRYAELVEDEKPKKSKKVACH